MGDIHETVKQALAESWRVLTEAARTWAEGTPIMPYACERCDLGYEDWQVECDDCGGPVEKRDLLDQ